MKRDMELIRKILIKLEDDTNPKVWKTIEIEGKEQKEISYHIKLLSEEKMIEARDSGLEPLLLWQAKSLTTQGHDFLDSIRDRSIYTKMKENMGERLATMPLSLVSSVALELLKEWTMKSFGFKN